MANVTVALPKNAAAPAEVRHGARHYVLAPGESAEVPEHVAPYLVEQGARTRKSKDSGSDES